MRTLLVVLAAAPPAAAQLSDLQPGRNFPTAPVMFGDGERSENVDLADVDNDGDIDVVVANGGGGVAQPNRIFINLGRIQGGVEGTFAEETATRLEGAVDDSSRDAEILDYDDDGDNDLFFANRGTPLSGGAVSRAFVNLGASQGGAVGYFADASELFWGDLVSIPPTDEVGAVDGQGPWRGFSCDCDFGDLDDDGDLDLFFSTYGPALDGTRDSLIFLNDGAGTFDELWPWADPGSELNRHFIDIDLADIDGDFDLDVFGASRETSSRIYRNNLYGGTGAGELFTDVSATWIPELGPGGEMGWNYEVEMTDLDGDGDFDAWFNNAVWNSEFVLQNDGTGTFALTDWIRGDPVSLENEIDYIDFDGDGDLDGFLTNVFGENWLFQNGTADGVPQTDGVFHRTGTSDGGSLASWPETPLSGNGGFTRDADAGDLDGDGDEDIALVNNQNQANRVLMNELGVPDAHAPTFAQVTVQADKADGSDTVIHAQVRDNSGYYVIAQYDVDLVYGVDGGVQTCVPMTSQSGQQFRAVIPGGLDGTITYHVEATDRAGNTGVSATTSYVQSSSGVVLWERVDCGTPGANGRPDLELSGLQTAGSTVTIDLRDGDAQKLALLYLGVTGNPTPFKGGKLYPFPVVLVIPLLTDAGGQIWVQTTWPAGVSSGAQIWFQLAIDDTVNPTTTALSNAVVSTAP